MKIGLARTCNVQIAHVNNLINNNRLVRREGGYEEWNTTLHILMHDIFYCEIKSLCQIHIWDDENSYRHAAEI